MFAAHPGRLCSSSRNFFMDDDPHRLTRHEWRVILKGTAVKNVKGTLGAE
jgi:hypothetical protein